MSEENENPYDAEAQAAADASAETANEAPAPWKPEPRQWLWSDIFKTPMIACKFRCMLVSIVTIAAIGLVGFVFKKILAETADIQVIGPLLEAIACILPCIIFGLGGTLVAIFIKAELLDDDYPTVKEALTQYKKRIVAAAMVPLFLVGTLHFMHLGAYLYALLCSIPFVGSILYFASIPAFFIWILITFFSIGVFLSMFVFPAIVAIRKHGWFDNVIDTLEAVGTKPHKVVASMMITGLLVVICCGIGITALSSAKGLSSSDHLYGYEVANTEAAANKILENTIPDLVFGFVAPILYANGRPRLDPEGDGIPGYHQYFTGALAGIFQTVLIYLIAGFGLNIIITGGMLSYLHVREDDYWDDEDLADLEKLAKELEEEALKDQDASAPVPAAGEDKATDRSSTVETVSTSKEEPEAEAADDASEDEAKDSDADKADVEEAKDEASEDADDNAEEDKKDD